MSNRDNQILLAILEAIDKIFSYVQNIKNIKEFGINNQVLDASLMNFVVIGELANKLSNEFRNEITTIDWSAIKGFRNIIAHDYFGVNTEEVWQIIMSNNISKTLYR